MIKVALIGLGKMGLSHQAIISAHPDIDLVAVCDRADYVLRAVEKYTGKKGYRNYQDMLAEERLDAVFVATPSHLHSEAVKSSLMLGLHVFCEKPFCLDPYEGEMLAGMAEAKKLINQVGYHYRFVGPFRELKRLTDAGILGRIYNIRAEACGPAVTRQRGRTWRTSKIEGGGCLYDYACHAIDLMNFIVGPPSAVGSSGLNRVFSTDVEDEVFSAFFYKNGMSGQLYANWSDEAHRKMSVQVTVTGTNGTVSADRQELRAFIKDNASASGGYGKGWNVKYTTELTGPVWFYLRGEEYSAQIDNFVQAIAKGQENGGTTFAAAAETDRVVACIKQAANLPSIETQNAVQDSQPSARQSRGALLAGLFG